MVVDRTGIGVRPLTRHIGAELEGLDLRHLEGRTFEVLTKVLLEHGVVFVPGQHLGPADLLALASSFGEIFPNPTAPTAAGFPDVVELETHDGRSPDTFHFDTSYVEKPPKASLLTMVTTPPVGGDTLWVSGCALYESFSPGMRELLDRLLVRYEAPIRERPDLRADHPLVRVHPDTGRRALFFDAMFATSVLGLHRAEGDALLSFLRSYVTDPTYACRYPWTEGTFAMWDNRCTMHRVASDFVGKRVIQRVTLAGDAPIGTTSLSEGNGL